MGVCPGWRQAHGPSRVLVATAGARRHRGLLRLCRDEALGPPTNARWCAKEKPRKFLARPKGFEPLTPKFVVWC